MIDSATSVIALRQADSRHVALNRATSLAFLQLLQGSLRREPAIVTAASTFDAEVQVGEIPGDVAHAAFAAGSVRASTASLMRAELKARCFGPAVHRRAGHILASQPVVLKGYIAVADRS